jgi:aminopeptidase YwaD
MLIKVISAIYLFTSLLTFSQDLSYPRHVISTLASSEYMGRGYCGKADFRSAEFIKNEFHYLGLEPFASNYYQYFNLNVNTFPGNIKVKFEDTELIPGKDFLVDPSSPSVKGSFKIIQLSRNDLKNNKLLNDTASGVFGNAIMIDLTDTSHFTKEEEEIINKNILSVKYNPDIPNSLTIILTDKKLSWNISDLQSFKPVIILNASSLKSKMPGEVYVNITALFKKNYRTQNVVGFINGQINPDSFIVITAHYDHLGILGKSAFFPGANDNASGVAFLLSLARYFSQNRPDYSMVFIAFSGEEAGLVGSSFFTQHPLFDLHNIRFLVNFDLAGTGDEGIKVVNATSYPKEFRILGNINSSAHLLPSVQSRGEACISDHCLFYMKGVPCFYIYTLGGITAYHDIYDRSETLPLTKFSDYLTLMEEFFKSLK